MTSRPSAQAVDLGGRVDLQLRIEVPPHSHVAAPSLLSPSGSLESLGQPAWHADTGPGGVGAVLHISYPLLVLGIGEVKTPAVELRWRDSAGESGGSVIPGDSLLSLYERGDSAGSDSRVTVTPITIDVRSAGRLDGVLEGLELAPSADVRGDNISLGVALLCSMAIAAAGFVLFAVWRAHRSHRSAGVVTGAKAMRTDDARARAVDALDALLRHCPEDPEALRDWIGACDAVIRRYLEGCHPGWGPHLTSREIIVSLPPEWGVDSLAQLWHWSDRARFGAMNPGTTDARAHGNGLRAWLVGRGTPA